MGCNCGGGGMSASRLYPAPPTGRGEKWEAVYPDGSTEVFRAKWQAEHATSIKGGSYRRVTTGPRR